jgi:hypothetical protein
LPTASGGVKLLWEQQSLPSDHEIALLRFARFALTDLVVMIAACCIHEDSKTQADTDQAGGIWDKCTQEHDKRNSFTYSQKNDIPRSWIKMNAEIKLQMR